MHAGILTLDYVPLYRNRPGQMINETKHEYLEPAYIEAETQCSIFNFLAFTSQEPF